MTTPIFDTFAAIYRYDGGWAFEDYGDAWRPWSEAWEELCWALDAVGWGKLSRAFPTLDLAGFRPLTWGGEPLFVRSVSI